MARNWAWNSCGSARHRRIARSPSAGLALTFSAPNNLFVRAQIEGADGNRETVHFFRHAAVGQKLFFFTRQVAPVEKQEFAAEQADAGGAVGLHVADIVRQLDVGMEFHFRAIQGRGAGGLEAFEFLLFQFPLALAQPVFGQHRLVRVDDDDALAAVDNDQFALANQAARMVQRHDGRDVEAARENRGMGSGAADIGDKSGKLVLLEQHHVGRGKVVRHQNAGLIRTGEAWGMQGGVAEQGFQHPFHHLHHVRFALPQVVVLDLVELRQQGVHLLLQRPLGVDTLGFDAFLGGGRERRVAQDQDVQIEKCIELRRRVGGNVFAQPLKFPQRALDRRIEARDFVGYLCFENAVLRDIQADMRDKMGMADGDAAGDGDAMHGEAHAPPW